MEFKFNNKNILVCGSTYGIGHDIAKGFINDGANVIFTGRTMSRLSYIKKKYKKSLSVKCDFSNNTDILLLKNAILKKYRKIDSIVFNVGFGKSKIDFEESIDDWINLININLIYAVRSVKILSPILKKNNKSTIVFISSICGLESTTAPLSYSSSKSALNLFSKNLSNIYIKDKIRVNCVSPGNVLFRGSTWDIKLKNNKKEVLRMISQNVPINRFAKPSEITNVVKFLVSDLSSFIIGQNIVVDGGQTKSI